MDITVSDGGVEQICAISRVVKPRFEFNQLFDPGARPTRQLRVNNTRSEYVKIVQECTAGVLLLSLNHIG